MKLDAVLRAGPDGTAVGGLHKRERSSKTLQEKPERINSLLKGIEGGILDDPIPEPPCNPEGPVQGPGPKEAKPPFPSKNRSPKGPFPSAYLKGSCFRIAISMRDRCVEEGEVSSLLQRLFAPDDSNQRFLMELPVRTKTPRHHPADAKRQQEKKGQGKGEEPRKETADLPETAEGPSETEEEEEKRNSGEEGKELSQRQA